MTLVGNSYRCILQDSGISILNGKYITTTNLLGQMAEYGDPRATSILSFKSSRDNFRTRMWPTVSRSNKENYDNGLLQLRLDIKDDTWTICPWNTITALGDISSLWFDLSFPGVPFPAVNPNPRQAVIEEQERYRLFASLPQDLQEKIYSIVVDDRDSLIDAFGLLYDGKKITRVRKKVRVAVEEIITKLGDDYTSLTVLFDNMFGDVEVMKQQIDYLCGLDTGTIPTEWKEAKVKAKVVRGRLEELALRS